MTKTHRNKSLGKWGEEFATKHIVNSGSEILARNARYGGVEVDILFVSQNILVVCEVKTRTNIDKGHPLEIITTDKISRLQSALIQAMSQFSFSNGRVDVIGIVLFPNIQLHHIQGTIF